MRILILGATGNFGNAVASLLSAVPGIDLRLTSSRLEGVERLGAQFPAADVVQADWNDLPSLVPAIDGVDKLLLVTPDFLTNEIQVTFNVVEAVIGAGRKCHIVRSMTVRPNITMADLSPEFIAIRCATGSHLPAKAILDVSGLPVTYLNILSWVMFNLAWFTAADVKANRRLAMPKAIDVPRAWLSESDIVEIFANVLADRSDQHVGKEYRLVGPDHYRWPDLARLFTEALGHEIGYVDEDLSMKAALGADYDAACVYFQHEIDAGGSVAPTDAGERLLGRPLEKLSDYIKRNAQHFT